MNHKICKLPKLQGLARKLHAPDLTNTLLFVFRDERHLVRISVRETEESQKMFVTMKIKPKEKDRGSLRQCKTTFYELYKIGGHYVKRLCLFEYAEMSSSQMDTEESAVRLKLFVPEYDHQTFGIRRFGVQFAPTDASLGLGGFVQFTGADLTKLQAMNKETGLTMRLAPMEENHLMMNQSRPSSRTSSSMSKGYLPTSGSQGHPLIIEEETTPTTRSDEKPIKKNHKSPEILSEHGNRSYSNMGSKDEDKEVMLVAPVKLQRPMSIIKLI